MCFKSALEGQMFYRPLMLSCCAWIGMSHASRMCNGRADSRWTTVRTSHSSSCFTPFLFATYLHADLHGRWWEEIKGFSHLFACALSYELFTAIKTIGRQCLCAGALCVRVCVERMHLCKGLCTWLHFLNNECPQFICLFFKRVFML